MPSPIRHDAISRRESADVLVLGAGTAGCCAALAAREGGSKRVALVERYGFLGGTSTQILDTFYGFFTPGESPRKVVGGIPDRIVDALDRDGRVFLRPNTYGAGTGVTYDPEYLKLVWDRLLAQAGVRVLLHTSLVDVETDASGQPAAAILWSKSGFRRMEARRFIDASGDADFCHLADIPCEKAGETEPAQSLTTTFRMSNVDLPAYEKAGGKRLLARRMEEAVAKGTHPLPRKAGSAHRMVQKGCIATVAVRVANMDPTDAEQLAEAEADGRRQAYVYEAFFRDCVPGFESANIVALSHQIGVRETRRVYGLYRLTREDCLKARQFEDAVLLCGAPIEDHRAAMDGEEETHWAYVPEGEAYGVPYGCLVPPRHPKVWVVGRCFSATHDAHASCRSMGQTMAMGQAAGLAAALSIETDCSAQDVSVARLQSRLQELGAILEVPARPAATGAADWNKNRPDRNPN